MDYLLVRTAGALACRGAAAMMLGLVALGLPWPTYLAMVFIFGAFAMIDGAFALVTAFDRETRFTRGWLMAEALAGLSVGVITAIWTRPAALNLIFVIAGWAIVTGLVKIGTAIRRRREVQGEWLLTLSGIASLLFGVLLIVIPLPGIIGLMWAIGIYGVAFGGMLLALAVRMSRRDERPAESVMRPAA